jgi:ElaB/YqjD/DUF883 family membrane-anchored ribosome-binding protein
MSSQNPTRPGSDDPTRAMPRATTGGPDVQPYGAGTLETNDTLRTSYPPTDTTTTTGAPHDQSTSDAGMKDKVTDAASTARDKATEMAGTAGEKARQMSGTATEKLDAQRDTVAGGLDSVATTLRDKAETIPGGDKTTQAAQMAADKMETASGYLREHEVGDMMSDVQTLVRSHPTESLVVALAAGFLLGRALKS